MSGVRAPGGRPFELHAGLDRASGKISRGLRRRRARRRSRRRRARARGAASSRSRFVAVERLLDLREQVVAAEEELDRLVAARRSGRLARPASRQVRLTTHGAAISIGRSSHNEDMDHRRGRRPLLGGLVAGAFMRRHWQKKPLLVRGALPGARRQSIARALFALAAHDDVESRLVVRAGARWSVRHGPIRAPRAAGADSTRLDAAGAGRRPARRRGARAARRVPLRRRRAPRRPDDLARRATAAASARTSTPTTCSCCRPQGGGAGASAAQRDAAPCATDVPLKILADFEPEQDGCSSPATCSTCRRAGRTTASRDGECMTCSIGFRAPAARRARRRRAAAPRRRRRRARVAGGADARPIATQAGRRRRPARIPAAAAALRRAAVDCGSSPDELARARALGEVLSEPKPGIVVRRRERPLARAGVGGSCSIAAPACSTTTRTSSSTASRIARRAATRRLMRRLADERALAGAKSAAQASAAARRFARQSGSRAGWVRGRGPRLTTQERDDTTGHDVVPIALARRIPRRDPRRARARRARRRRARLLAVRSATSPTGRSRAASRRVAHRLGAFPPQA